MFKKLAVIASVAALGFMAFSTTAPSVAKAQPGEELACKPTGAKCKNSMECCKGCTFTNDSGKGVCS